MNIPKELTRETQKYAFKEGFKDSQEGLEPTQAFLFSRENEAYLRGYQHFISLKKREIRKKIKRMQFALDYQKLCSTFRDPDDNYEYFKYQVLKRRLTELLSRGQYQLTELDKQLNG